MLAAPIKRALPIPILGEFQIYGYVPQEKMLLVSEEYFYQAVVIQDPIAKRSWSTGRPLVQILITITMSLRTVLCDKLAFLTRWAECAVFFCTPSW